MNPHLFVYGSLMSSAAHPMGERLRREARLVGEATICARLYRVSWYPGAVELDDPNERVHGEIYALATAATTLEWLDAYEGIIPGSDKGSEYKRTECPARLVSGEELRVWVYFFQKDVAELQWISGGRWAT